jgi:hypothetical protein
MSIQLNGDSTVPQPSFLLEELVQIQSDNMSINGGMQRNRINQKKQATLTYQQLSPAQYQSLIAKVTTGSGISYYNDQSNYAGGIFTFSGLPYFNEAEYVQGASLYRDFKVRLREQ